MKLRFTTVTLRLLSLIPFFNMSSIKSRIYRAAGAKIGEHVRFAPGAFLSVPDFKKLKIGDGVELGRDVNISCEEIEIGEATLISYGVIASGPSSLKIGSSCYLAPKVYIDLNEPVVIEDDVGIGADYIFTHSVWQPVTEGGPRKFAPVHIKRGAWIPAGVFIMPGVTIGERAIVGARALVVHDVPDGCLAVGIPAKVIKRAEENRKELTSEEKGRIIQSIIDDYLQRIKKTSEVSSQNRYADGSYQITEIERSGFFGRKKRLALLYTNVVVKLDQLHSIRGFCEKYDFVLLVSLPSLPTNVVESLDAPEFRNIVWFSVEDKMRKKSWDKDAMGLYGFFGSHYGIRFKIYRNQS